MNSFWASFFEHLKQCGRDETLFFVTLAVLVALVLVTAIFLTTDLHKYLVPRLPVLAVLVVWRAGVALRWARARRRPPLRFSPLSRDEWRVARSKHRKARK